MRKPDHRANDRRCERRCEPSDATKERSILIAVERERLQIAQRRVAGAEIVERDAHAERI